MKDFDRLISESINSSLRKLLKEDSVSGSFEQGFDVFDTKVKKFFQEEEMKLNNKKSYYETIKGFLSQMHNIILRCGYDFSLVKSEFSYNSLLEVKYFISGSDRWDEDMFFDNEDKVDALFDKNELDTLNIEIGLSDMRDKGGECFIIWRFDSDSIFEFEY